MYGYISQYISTYDLYLWTKSIHHSSLKDLFLLPISNAKWDTISVDFVIELPEYIEFNIVITVVDLVSMRAYFVPIEDATRLFLHYI